MPARATRQPCSAWPVLFEQSNDVVRIKRPVEMPVRAAHFQHRQPFSEAFGQLVIRRHIHHPQGLPCEFWHTEKQLERPVTERAMIGAVKDQLQCPASDSPTPGL